MMHTDHLDRAKTNDERAAAQHAERLDLLLKRQQQQARRHARERENIEQAILKEERSDVTRALVRKTCDPLLDQQHVGDVPLDEIIEGVLNWAAGRLACQPLDESAGLKVRRLGRRMATEIIAF